MNEKPYKGIGGVILISLLAVSCDLVVEEGNNAESRTDKTSGPDNNDKSEVVATPTPSLTPAFVGPTTSFIEQYGVKFTFDDEYPYGQFANGDWWVVGPLTIVRITPDTQVGRHGFEVNPSSITEQPFDNRIKTYRSERLPSLPLTLEGNHSVVKAVSIADSATCEPCLQTAVVLTVLEERPIDDGKFYFRPPYFGSDKPMYDVRQLRSEQLPSLADPGIDTPTLDWVTTKFGRVQLDHKSTWTGRAMHPISNMSEYGATIASDTADAALRLMLAGNSEDKMPALIAYVQAGLDLYHMLKGGMVWKGDGGHSSGRKLPILFAGWLLDRNDMLTDVKSAAIGTFGEDDQTFYNGDGVALWGSSCSEADYWQRINTGTGRKDCRDPYGQVDGGGTAIGGSYQFCCTSKVWKGHALAGHLIPTIKSHWNHNAFFDYVDRWVNQGVIALPDTCSLTPPTPPYTGTCVAGGPRFPDKHGINADDGNYGSEFAKAMWNLYR